MHTAVLLLRDALGLGGALVGIWELTRQASGAGWRKLRAFSAAAALILAALLAVWRSAGRRPKSVTTTITQSMFRP
ncbi:hypothetical protein [Streptomyces sp. V1I1]|uniref:hypothetical protein n=1 Tax=Streptomyces sp. V1I1 TaxID=3042272 RepID=UPI002782C43E|nr:hypothetical protein [Streptomyces sp. V1I1]MDQ0941905.1 type II secretory pathway component PulL [Streptomyces sp. V1I1]